MQGGDIAGLGGVLFFVVTLWLWFTSTEGR